MTKETVCYSLAFCPRFSAFRIRTSRTLRAWLECLPMTRIAGLFASSGMAISARKWRNSKSEPENLQPTDPIRGEAWWQSRKDVFFSAAFQGVINSK
jgi:hypothetical protein